MTQVDLPEWTGAG